MMAKFRQWFTYQEILDEISIEDVSMPRYAHDVQMSDNWFTKLMENQNVEVAVYTLNDGYTDELINDVINALMGIVYNRHAKDYISCVEDAQLVSASNTMVRMECLNKLINVLDLTLPKYIPMLKVNEFNSFDPIAGNLDETSEDYDGNNQTDYAGNNTSSATGSDSSSGQDRMNDTPQNGGLYADDEHTSSITESSKSSTSSNNVNNNSTYNNKDKFKSQTNRANVSNIGTLMSRLVEMYNNFESIILKWSNEFNQLFFKEEQI